MRDMRLKNQTVTESFGIFYTNERKSEFILNVIMSYSVNRYVFTEVEKTAGILN